MKQYLSLFLLLFFSAIAYSQKMVKLPEFGKVDLSELQMTECAFDKGAAAMVIFDEAESVFRLNLTSAGLPYFEQTDHRTRIKIFNQKGFDNANIKIRYPSSSNMVSITHLSAQTYNLDASGNMVITKLDKASIYDKKINSRFSEKIFAFPDVKAGSVIEYKYILDNASRDKWYFQKSIPVQFSRFIMDFPPELIISFIPYCSLPLSYDKSDTKGVGNYSWYAMENIPGLTDEPYMSCREDYLQRLEARLVALDFPGIPRKNLVHNWPDIIKELIDDEDFGRQLKRDIPRTADLDVMLRGINDPFSKMLIIHDYVRKNMQWNGYSNIWALDGVRSAWKDKKGTSGEINLILINLLKDAGLSVHPLLVSTRANGIVNTGVAGYDQFDKVMAHVTIGESVYILDATEKITPSSLIPLEVMASEGLLIAKPDSYEWGWHSLFDNKHVFSRKVILEADADTNGTLKGLATIVAGDYERCKLLPEGKNSVVKLKDNLTFLQTVRIDSLGFENLETDSMPLIQHVKFESTGSSSGAYKYFSVNLFAGLEKNPFVAEDRTTDIFFGANQKYEINAVIFIPEGYIMDELPKNLRMRLPDTSIVFTRQSAYASGILNLRFQLEFNTPFFSRDVYPQFREFYKKLFDLLNEKFVYRKS
jgi:hypothetical protein